MDKIDDYITIEEASEITKKSISTIRRFVAAHKHSKNDIIRVDVNNRNRPLYRINKDFLLASFDISQKDTNDPLTEAESLQKKIVRSYLYYKNAYITTRRLLIISLCFSIALIVIFFLFGYSYKKELVNRYEQQTSQMQEEIDSLKKAVGSNKDNYKTAFEQYDNLHDDYNKKQDIERKKLLNRIKKMEDRLKQQNSIYSSTNTEDRR